MRVGICPICGEKTEDRKVEVVDSIDGRLVVLRNVPAEVCTSCGERLFSAKIMRRMEELWQKIHGRRIKPDEIREIEIFSIST